MSKEVTSAVPAGRFIVYKDAAGRTRLDVRFDGETVWLTQAQMAELFGVSVPNISMHITNILAEGELERDRTIQDFLIVRSEGVRQVRRQVAHYNLDMIISVGYRVTSRVATQFRIWATTVLREYIQKGFALDDERLENPGGIDYFDELLRRIRAIRASEKRFYQKVRDLFAQTSVDYDKSADVAKQFFATIQNKLLFAVTEHTAAELIAERIDPGSPSFGLTSWSTERPHKLDATVAKNYLNDDELASLNRLVEQFLAFADGQAERHLVTTMDQWVDVTDRLLVANSYPLLAGAGQVSHEKIQTLVDQKWASFTDARRLHDQQAALDQEADDLTQLWEFERGIEHE